MAKNTETETTEVKKPSLFSETGVTDGLRWGELTFEGETYRIRRITVDEGDTAWDASMDEKSGKFNGRLNSRLLLSFGIVSPPTNVDDMGKWSSVKLLTLLKGYDELNDLPPADTAGNA